LLNAYVVKCGGDPAGQFAPVLEGTPEEAPSDASDIDDEFVIDAPEGPINRDDLTGADAECFDLLTALQARQQADQLEWDTIAENPGPLSAIEADEIASQRLGCRGLPPKPLDEASWAEVCGPSDESGLTEMVTLSRLFEKAQVVGQSPCPF
jgi:hypothetical protein